MRIYVFFRSHRNVGKQTIPLQVDDIITNKSLVIFEACIAEFSTHIVLKFWFLQIWKIFKNIILLHYHMVPSSQLVVHICVSSPVCVAYKGECGFLLCMRIVVKKSMLVKHPSFVKIWFEMKFRLVLCYRSL